MNACANVTGSIKLPLLFIGKSKRPRCFKNTNMDSFPVIYVTVSAKKPNLFTQACVLKKIEI